MPLAKENEAEFGRIAFAWLKAESDHYANPTKKTKAAFAKSEEVLDKALADFNLKE